MSFLKKIFKRDNSLEPISLDSVGVDMHSHLIAGVDDGAVTVRDSIHLIKELAKFGYTHFITTPHIMSDLYPNKKDDLLRRVDILRKEIEKQGLGVTIEVAAEYFLDQHFMDLIKKDELLTFGDGYVLFEMSFMQESPLLQSCIFELLTAGYKPILAHPERYSYWHGKFDKYENLVDQGVSLQLNINSVTGHYSPQVAKISKNLVENKLINFLGTDCHHKGHLELMGSAIKSSVLHELIHSNCLENIGLKSI